MDENGDDMVPIRVAARMLGVHPNTLRNWERQGVIQPVRTASGHRRYSRAEIRRLLQPKGNENAPESKPEGE